MRYLALATDYDGTLAHDGRVDQATLAALERLRATGRKLILVTGRELADLLAVFPEVGLFESVVAENGALLYRPATRETRLLSEAPPERFVQELQRRGVTPLSVGHAIVATVHPHETTVIDVIGLQGLELHVIFNKGAVMILPSGVNKATGLRIALKELGLSPHEVVGVGDAENDHAFLSYCECAVAVANALPAVKERANLVTKGHHGAGVVELIDHLVASDLQDLEGRLTHHHLLLGTRDDGTEVRIPPHGLNLLIAGPSGSGKSTAATGFLEQLELQRYQYCIIDPEGDYENLSNAVVLGGAQRSVTADEVMQILKESGKNVVVNLVGLPLADRPPFFMTLLPRLLERRRRTGRPHWLIVDETHHLLPTAWEPGQLAISTDLKQLVFITVHPEEVAHPVLATVDLMLAVGQKPGETIAGFCKALGEQPPAVPFRPSRSGEVVCWPKYRHQGPFQIRVVPHRTERRRHIRKYAEGELPPDQSFFFRGPEGKLNLRAQNLLVFLQLAEGVDDATWEYHLRRGDYSGWFRERIKDETLAAEAAEVEGRRDCSPGESRTLIREIVERHYTLPASTPAATPKEWGSDQGK